MGHRVKLIPPQYVKPFVKRSKNDRNDAEAIGEAASRPAMRTVPLKTSEEQAATIIVKHREMLVAQRTQAINALRGHAAEFRYNRRQRLPECYCPSFGSGLGRGNSCLRTGDVRRDGPACC
jgi:transposase